MRAYASLKILGYTHSVVNYRNDFVEMLQMIIRITSNQHGIDWKNIPSRQRTKDLNEDKIVEIHMEKETYNDLWNAFLESI